MVARKLFFDIFFHREIHFSAAHIGSLIPTSTSQIMLQLRLPDYPLFYQQSVSDFIHNFSTGPR